jgi:hypothetical protein
MIYFQTITKITILYDSIAFDLQHAEHKIVAKYIAKQRKRDGWEFFIFEKDSQIFLPLCSPSKNIKHRPH